MFILSHFKKDKKIAPLPTAPKPYDVHVNFLVIGLQESGKTTLQRQLDLIYGVNEIDPKYYQRLIYGNTLATLIRLIENSEKLDIQLQDDNQERVRRVLSTPIELARNRLPRFPLQLGYDCKCVWEDTGIQKVYEYSAYCPEFRTPGRTKFYMENMFRVFSPAFSPTETDIISAYDPSDITHSSLLARQTLDSFAKANMFDQKVSFFVVFNICDIFLERIQTVDLKTCFPEYQGGLSVENALDFLVKRFSRGLVESCASFSTYVMNLLDTKSVTDQFDQILDVVGPDAERRGLFEIVPSLSSASPGLRPTSVLPHTSSIMVTPLNNDNHVEITNNTTTTTTTTEAGIDVNNNNTTNANNNNSKESNNIIISDTSSNSSGTSNNSRKPIKDNKKREKAATKEQDRINKEQERINKEQERLSKVREKERLKEEKVKKDLEKKNNIGGTIKSSPRKKRGIKSLDSGFCSIQGRRKNMEDAHILFDRMNEEFKLPTDDLCSFYGVYDGHGGVETAKALEPLCHKCIIETPAFAEGNYEKALKDGFALTDRQLLGVCGKSGSTGMVAMICEDTLYTANVGDSECVLARAPATKGAAHELAVLSYKHTAKDDVEKQRITDMGGMIIFGRVFGSLAVTRSFGDKEFKEGEKLFVTYDPYQTTTQLTPRDRFLILACDGLWEKLEYQEAVDIVVKNLKLGKSAQEISDALVNESFERGSGDNITAIALTTPLSDAGSKAKSPPISFRK
eukprot:gene8971-10522_t